MFRPESKSEGTFKFAIKLIAAIRTANRFARETDPKQYQRAWRRTIIEAAEEILPISLIAPFVEDLLKKFIEDPHLVVVAITTFVIAKILKDLWVANMNARFYRDNDRFLLTMKRRARDKVAEKAASLPLSELFRPEVAMLRRDADHGASNGIADIWGEARTALSQLLQLVFSFVAVLMIDKWLALGLFTALGALEYWMMSSISTIRDELNEHHRDVRRLKDEYKRCNVDEELYTQGRLFASTRYFSKKLAALRTTIAGIHAEAEERKLAVRMKFNILRCGAAIIATIALITRAEGGMELEKFLFCSGAFGVFIEALCGFLNLQEQMAYSVDALAQYERFMNLTSLEGNEHAAEMVFRAEPTISIENVSYAYENTETCALRDVNHTFLPGTVTMIVGENGSGKTTLANAMSKLVTIKQGVITADGTPLPPIAESSWHRQFAYVTAGDDLPQLTLKEVIAQANSDEVDEERLERAASIAGVDEFVNDLPEKFNTPLGTIIPGGRDFSKGQRQRIRVAAGLYRFLSPEVHGAIFDEPMDKCDHTTKIRFYSSLREIVGTKTIIVIAHDPLFINHADVVLLMENGRPAFVARGPKEVGAYQAVLIKQDGRTTIA